MSIELPGQPASETDGSRLRVLFINDTSRNGGPGQTLLDILKFLPSALIDRSVMLPREDIVSRRLREHNAVETLIIEPAIIENLVQPLSRAMTRDDFAAPRALCALRAAGNVVRAVTGALRLIRRVRQERYAVIFCNGTTANFIGGVLAALLGVPVVWHVFYPSVPLVLRGSHRWLAARSGVRSILCVSNAVASQFGRGMSKVRVLHDALDIAEFDRMAAPPVLKKELGLPEDTLIFGAHGRILPHKGFVELIRAAHLVCSRLDETTRARCRFVILGDTPQDMPVDHLEECRELVRTLGLEKQVLFIGFRPLVRSYLADFDVALVPSVYPDPLPRAVLEAMAMRKPVIAFAVGGMGEMLTDGVEGRLLNGHPPDIEGLVEACLNVIKDPATWRVRGKAARGRIERDFNARTHADAIARELFRSAKVSVP
ncbi:glycosyltransferase family 4 protein [Acetobacter oeni]|nr:glycosyltransferase family 4 protein [Acetobacter oeni]MBB3884727.1 glycosyltransferase involved in cell wall biosynthesis [Acetobacter oeni]NHO20691.1 glycosyltransferase [Acetobacter oeni]GBR04635.1 putative glucosyltransferase [Acetobacter oeni LMG 21952]